MQSQALVQTPDAVKGDFKYHVPEPLDFENLNPHQAHSIILRQVPAGVRVLDVGCATGYLGRFLTKERGCLVDGIEANHEAAHEASEYLRNVWVGNVDDESTFDLVSEKYDVILCAAILEHLTNPELALERLSNLLAEDGVLIAGLPNVAHWSIRWSLLRGRWDYSDYGILDRTHLHFYTLKTAKEMFEGAGYVLNRLEVSDIGVGPLHSVLRLLPRGRIWLRNWLVNHFPNLFAFEIVLNVSLPRDNPRV
jgi:2-polyprenyl-3-methyl-5-hydroxy-6-metoxy-1,4-benzoquinol methylase